jgi:hypothetical protein
MVTLSMQPKDPFKILFIYVTTTYIFTIDIVRLRLLKHDAHKISYIR